MSPQTESPLVLFVLLRFHCKQIECAHVIHYQPIQRRRVRRRKFHIRGVERGRLDFSDTGQFTFRVQQFIEFRFEAVSPFRRYHIKARAFRVLRSVFLEQLVMRRAFRVQMRTHRAQHERQRETQTRGQIRLRQIRKRGFALCQFPQKHFHRFPLRST